MVAKEEKSLEKVVSCEEKSLEKVEKIEKSPLKNMGKPEKVVIWKTIIFEKESEEEKMLKIEYLLRGK